MNAPQKDYLAIEAARQSGVYYPRGVVLVRGAGTQVWDDQGRQYYDAASAYGITPLGHAHRAITQAIAEQAGTLLACSNSFGNDQRALYLEELTAVLPAQNSRIFLCNSGTEANEAAIKFARLTTQKPGVIAFNRGFHGRTMGALSFTANPKYREPFEPLVPGAKFVSFNNLEAVDTAWDETVGAVLVEIVQGEGGVHAATKEFMYGLQARCTERGAMLIVDEVQTGFGRTGKMFASEHFGLKPDLLTLAKGIANGFPMGAVAIGPRIQALPVGAHGNTFGGSPLACAVARVTLQTLLQERLVEGAAQKGERLLKGLQSIPSRRIREVRGLGLIVAIELREKSAPYLHALQDRGILALFAGTTVLRFLPPLISTDAEIDRIVEATAEVLA